MIVRVHPSISALRVSDHRALEPRRGPIDTGAFLGQVQTLLSVPKLVKHSVPSKPATQELLHSPIIRTPKAHRCAMPVMSKAKAAAKFPYTYAAQPDYVESLKFRQ